MDQYYRVLNPSEEPSQKWLLPNVHSAFRQEVFEYRQLSHCIYSLAQNTRLKIINAVRVAENTPAFLDVLNAFFQSGDKFFNLSDLCINDPIEKISADELYAFTSRYISEINSSGLCYDWGHDNCLWELIWETIRNNEFPTMPSRLDSVFLFKDKTIALQFQEEQRDMNYIMVPIKLSEGQTEEFDMNWFTEVSSNATLTEAQEYARKYWRQEMTEHPIIEVLHKGQYFWIGEKV